MTMATTAADEARRRRWRLLLGEPAQEPLEVGLTAGEQGMDAALGALYDEAGETEGTPSERRYGALGSSAPQVARWLGDIRQLLPHERGPSNAARRDRPARPDQHAARAGAAGLGAARRAPRGHPGQPQPGDAGDGQAHGPASGGQGGGRDRAADHQLHPGGGARGGQPIQPQPATPAARCRLERHHPPQLGPLRTRTADRGSRAAGRLRAPGSGDVAGRDRGGGPVGLDGRVGGLRRSVRGDAGLDLLGAHLAGGLRRRHGGSDRPAGRPGRGAVRVPARRRHRHQPGARVLPAVWSAGRPRRSWC